MSKKIYLSPSMQIHNAYATGNTTECEQCNRIANYAKIALERCGFSVKKAPEGQSMTANINESNAWGADLHIPIHTNAANGQSGGTVVFVYDTSASNMKLATPIYNAVQAITPGQTNFGVRANPELAELNQTRATAVYVECEFHDRADYAQWIINHVEDLGEAIAKGVCSGYGVTYIAPNNTITLDTSSYVFTSKGQVYQFLARCSTEPKVSSSNTSAVTVVKAGQDSRGYLYKITAINNGLSYISATLGNKTVGFKASLGCQLDTSSYTFNSIGQKYTFLARTAQKPQITLSNPSVVSCEYYTEDNRGFLFNLTAKAKGTCTITAKLGNFTGSFVTTVK